METGSEDLDGCRLAWLTERLRVQRRLRCAPSREDAIQETCLRIVARGPEWRALSLGELERLGAIILRRVGIDHGRRCALAKEQSLDFDPAAGQESLARDVRGKERRKEGRKESLPEPLDGECCVLRQALASEPIRSCLTRPQQVLLGCMADGIRSNRELAAATGRKRQAVQQMRQRIQRRLTAACEENGPAALPPIV